MEKKEIIDETFDPNRSESYNLSIQASHNGFLFSIKDSVRDLYISLVTYPLDHELSVNDDWSKSVCEIFSQHDILSKKFKSVHFTFDSSLFTVIPTEIFIPEKAKQLFELVHPLPDLCEVRYNQIKDINATILYAIPSSLTSQWLFRQPQTVFIGYPTPLVYNCSFQKLGKDEPNVLVNFSNHFFVNVISQNNELKYCNTFELHNNDDSAYHILNSCKLNGINPAVSLLTINGYIEELESLVKLLSKYFKKVTFENDTDGHHYSYSIVKYKKTYWNLFNLSKCE